MALPNEFDPRNMSFGNIANATPIIGIPRNSISYTSTNNRSLWSRFNSRITNIGNWFADHAESVLGVCSIILTVIIVITAIYYVINTWINEGFWYALLIAAIYLIIGSVVWYIGAVIIVIIVNVVMYGLRLLFWNGWTLLLAFALGIGGWFWTRSSSSISSDNFPKQSEIVTSTTNTYVCTAKTSVKVRRYPTIKAPQIGSIMRGQEIDVIDFNDGFAHILYNGQDGYVSVEFIKKKD